MLTILACRQNWHCYCSLYLGCVASSAQPFERCWSVLYRSTVAIKSTVEVQDVLQCSKPGTKCYWEILYSGKFSLGVNFPNFHRHIRFCENKNRKKNEIRRKLMLSLWVYIDANMYLCEQDGSLQSVCPLNGCCREESAHTIQNANKPIRDGPELSKSRSEVLNTFRSTYHFSSTVALHNCHFFSSHMGRDHQL